MSIQRFDTLICGDDLSGLIAANLLSYFNYKVVVLRDSFPADRYQFNGYTLPVSPVLVPPLRFGDLLSQIRHYLSISQSELEEESEFVEKFQYITSKLRVDIYVEKNDTIEEFYYELGVKREISKKFITAVNLLMEELIEIYNKHIPYPPYSFWDKRKVKESLFARFNSKESPLCIFNDKKIPSIFKALLSFVVNADTNNIVPSQEAILGFLFLDKWLILPSLERLKSIFVKRLEERGNLVLYASDGNYQIEKRGFNYYLRDEKKQNSFRIDSVILSSDSNFLSKVISPKRFKSLNLENKIYYLRHTTNFVVNSSCIPEIASKCIVLNKGTSDTVELSNLFQVSISKAMKGRAIVKENKVISITTFVKPSIYNLKNSELLNKNALDALLSIFPFADEYIINSSSVFDAEMFFDVNMNEVNKKTTYRFPHYLFAESTLKDGILLYDMRTGIKNFVNAFSVFSPIGIFGDFMSAVRAAEIISKNIIGR
ncbi:MAG: hypothetical protein N2746_03495 [Deltaproteobacteria bacterium]|nr:hypothetical protein [Deltaproteobacteria bacterium]